MTRKRMDVLKEIKEFYMIYGVLPVYSQLNSSKNTVHNVFRALEEEGIIYKKNLQRVIGDFKFFK